MYKYNEYEINYWYNEIKLSNVLEMRKYVWKPAVRKKRCSVIG